MANDRVLYHASRTEYSSNQVVNIEGDRNRFTIVIESEGRGWVEEVLERGRPEHCTPRPKAVFAFDAPGACLRFAEGEDRQRPSDEAWHFYEVQMQDATKHPMCLVDQIDRRGADADHADLVREYWEPQEDWNRYEYLAETMRILQQIPRPSRSERDLDLMRAMEDRDVALAL